MNSEEVIQIAARVAHEVNRAFCEGIGDSSHVAWEEAPTWQREASVANVRAVLSDPSRSAEVSHQEWFAEKTQKGWRWGSIKSGEDKTHPCLVPYSELPPEQRVKDALLNMAIRGVLVFHGLLPESA